MAVRRGRLSRLSRLGGMALSVAGEAAGAAGQAVAKGGDAAAARFHARTAVRLADALGEMKGLPHKVGQILSVLDDAIPTEHRAVYGEVLGRLQAHAEPIAWSELQAVVEAELGDLDAQFAAIDPEPAAAASIGQVHRAVMPDGRPVALKIQYPGVAEAVQADLANIGALVGALTGLLPRTSVEHLVEDIAGTFREELDYCHEAEVQQAFAARWADDAAVLVPRVVAERSTARVLCTEWVDGLSFDAAVAASPALRGQWGAGLWRFTWVSVLRDHVVHGDPHPGNYVFRPDGRVAMLDFGATAALPPALAEGLGQAARRAVDGADDASLLAALLPALGLPTDLDPAVAGAWTCFARLLMEPMGATQPFRFDSTYVQGLMAEVQRAKLEMAKKALWKGVPTPTSQGAVLMMRTAVGQAAVLARLEAEADFRAAALQAG